MIRNILLLFFASLALGREPFTPSDLWLWREIADPAITADGAQVVYVEKWAGREAGERFSNLRVVSSRGSAPEKITDGPWRDREPRWSPDGNRLAWISDRSGRHSIRVRTIGSGRETEIAVPGAPPSGLAWSPDGLRLAFAAWVDAKTTLPGWIPELLGPYLDTGAPRGSVEIFLVPATGGEIRQLTHDTFVSRGPLAWTPDGQWILCSARRATTPDQPADAEIYGVHVPDGETRWLTRHPGPDEDPLPSPDGGRIAWISAATRPAAYAVRKLWVMGVDGQRMKALTGSLDRDVTSPQWSSDSRTVYFLAADRGATHVYAARNDGTVRQVTNRDEVLRHFSLADNGRAVTVRSNDTEAGEIVTFAVDLPGGVTSLSSPNQQLLATRDIGPREQFHFQSDGKDVQAWLVRPPHAGAGKDYPLLVDVAPPDPRAGTPHSMCGAAFSLRAQIFAAAGFAVLCVDTRGTPGFGEDFGNLLRTRFPGDDFDDLMRGIDSATGRGGIDAHRVAISGGLLAAWAIGHTTRFTAAVLHRPVADWTSAVALEPGRHPRAAAWMGALPWDDPDQYTKHSPLFFAQNFKTPALVIAPDDDAQARELWFALRARTTGSAWARIPEDGKPATDVLRLETELAWLKQQLR